MVSMPLKQSIPYKIKKIKTIAPSENYTQLRLNAKNVLCDLWSMRLVKKLKKCKVKSSSYVFFKNNWIQFHKKTFTSHGNHWKDSFIFPEETIEVFHCSEYAYKKSDKKQTIF